MKRDFRGSSAISEPIVQWDHRSTASAAATNQRRDLLNADLNRPIIEKTIHSYVFINVNIYIHSVLIEICNRKDVNFYTSNRHSPNDHVGVRHGNVIQVLFLK